LNIGVESRSCKISWNIASLFVCCIDLPESPDTMPAVHPSYVKLRTMEPALWISTHTQNWN
jgi:hypothetical protein